MNKNEVQEWTKIEKNNSASDFGKLFVLPSIHIGSDRYMRQKMHEIIAISNCIGHPDVFITLRRNPHWPEIQRTLLSGQRAEDRPDLCDRVCRMKLKLLLTHLTDESPFGRVLAHVSVVELQKRGLVHAHIIPFLKQQSNFSLQDPLQVGKFVSAEIPPHSMPHLRITVLKHMIHKPCTIQAFAPFLKAG